MIKPLFYGESFSSSVIYLSLDGDAEKPSPFVKLMMCDQVGSHLFELALKVNIDCDSTKLITSQHVNEEDYQKILEHVFQEHMLELTRHPIANFVVQSVLENPRSGPYMTGLLEELLPHIKNLVGIFTLYF
jgi:hypothetical protein